MNLKEIVDRFLGWPLPKTFSPDCGISFDGRKDDEWNKNKTWPIGTNLFTAEEARQMFEHALADTPCQDAVGAPAPEPVAWVGETPNQRRLMFIEPTLADFIRVTPLYAHPAAPAPETVAWMIVEPGCECGPTFGTENAAWSALTKAPPGSELVELIRRKA